MENYHHIWLAWARMLHRWGLQRVGYLILSELGSLNALLAQGIYLLEPFFPTTQTQERLRALCALMEDESSRHDFLNLLKEQGELMP